MNTCEYSMCELVESSQAGDREAFARLAARYRHGVYAICLERCADFEVAEDLTQEALVKAWESLGGLRDPQPGGRPRIGFVTKPNKKFEGS